MGGARSCLALHERWTQDSGVSLEERSRFEEEVLSHVIGRLMVYDQLNFVNLAGPDLAGRRLPLLEAEVLDGGAAARKGQTTSCVSRRRGMEHSRTLSSANMWPISSHGSQP